MQDVRQLDSSTSRSTGIPSGARLAVFRARRRRHLLAARRRGGAPPPPGESGDAAFLLAERRVLRHAGVLVQRPARSRSTGSSTGATSSRCCCCRRCSSTSRWCSRSGPTAGSRSDAGRTAAAAVLSAGAAARRREGRGDPARRSPRRRALERRRAGRARRAALPRASASIGGLAIMIRALRRVRSVTARRQLRWIVVGHGARRACRSCFGYVAAVRARASRRPRAFELDRGAARPGAAGVRVGDHPLPPDGRRGHHQARRWSTPRRSRRSRRSTRSCSALAGAVLPAPAKTSATRSSRCWRRWCVVLLSRPVKNAIQTGARSRLLPRSLRLPPRARRLRARPQQRSRSAAAQRAAGAPRHRNAGRRSHGADAGAERGRAATAQFVTIAHAGFGGEPPALARRVRGRRRG